MKDDMWAKSESSDYRWDVSISYGDKSTTLRVDTEYIAVEIFDDLTDGNARGIVVLDYLEQGIKMGINVKKIVVISINKIKI